MMVRMCPKPCGRLATAAILIIIGVVQLLVGVILLRSEFANLLSGPDFMTASSNIAVGSVYGITASIWKVSIKRKSMKNNARSNVLAALLLSVITINTTTLIVLITGEGHKLLTLHLENNRLGIVDFADEILAYAFVTSVCSPITCIVVALVAFSGRCLEIYRDRKTAKQGNKITNEDRYKWAFEVKERDGSASKTPSSVSESLSTSDDSVFSENSYSRRESALSVDSIPSPLDTWTQTRETMLSADFLSPQQSLFALQNPNFRNSPYEKIIPRIKESSLVKHSPGDLTQTTSLCYRSTNPPNICRSILKRSSSNPAPGEEVFLRNSVDKQPCCIKNEISEERVQGRYNVPARNGNKGDINHQINRNSEHLRCQTLVSANGKATGSHEKSGQTLNPTKESKKGIIHFMDPVTSELTAETLKELKQKVHNIAPGASVALAKLPNDSKGIKEASGPGDPDRVPVEDTGPRKYSHNSKVCQYELCSGLDENNILSRRPLLTNESSTSIRLPTNTTTSSHHPAIANKTMNASSSAIGRLRSKSVDFSRDDSKAKKKYNIPEVVNWVMTTEGKKMKRHLGSPKAVSLKQNRRPDSSIKMSMASIAEMPSEDDTYDSSLHDTAFIAPKSRRESHIIDENSNIEVRMSPSSRRISSVRTAQRKSSISSNSLLKRMWSSAASTEPKVNVADLIVDKDSLIGLSDEELLARTYRIRSLRKSVEHRLKQKAEAGK